MSINDQRRAVHKPIVQGRLRSEVRVGLTFPNSPIRHPKNQRATSQKTIVDRREMETKHKACESDGKIIVCAVVIPGGQWKWSSSGGR